MDCKICGNIIDENIFIVVKEMMFGTEEEYFYYYCECCNSLSLKNIPGDFNKYYRDYYAEKKIFLEITGLRKKMWAIRRKLSKTKLWTLIKVFFYNDILNWAYYADVDINSMILDVGCGNGYILNEFSKHGFKKLFGIDPYFSTDEYNHINLFKTDLLNFNTDMKFDLIMFHHSFEHVKEQEETLQKSCSLLRNDGVILIRMPVINKAYEIYKENWVQIDAPRHITVHSEKSIGMLCNKNNLKIYYSYYDSTEFQFLGSEQFKRGISFYADNSYKVNSEQSIFTEEDFIIYEKIAKEYNKKRLGDQAVFFIRKIW